MGKYFTIAELTRSEKAKVLKIDNIPPPVIKVSLECLIGNLLDPIREVYGKPIQVNSGFRCPVLNKAVGGAASSQLWLLVIAILLIMFTATACSPCKQYAKKCKAILTSKTDTLTNIRIEKTTVIEKDTLYIKVLQKEKENIYGNLLERLTASTSYAIAVAWVDTANMMLHLQIKNKDSVLLPYKIIYKEIYVSDSSSNKSSQNEVVEVYKQSSWQKFMYSSGLVVWIILALVLIFYCVKFALWIKKGTIKSPYFSPRILQMLTCNIYCGEGSPMCGLKVHRACGSNATLFINGYE